MWKHHPISFAVSLIVTTAEELMKHSGNREARTIVLQNLCFPGSPLSGIMMGTLGALSEMNSHPTKDMFGQIFI